MKITPPHTLEDAWRHAQAQADELYVAIDRRLGGRLALLHRTWLAYSRDDGPTMARSIAYYALFSFFPLLLALISVGSSVLASPLANKTALDLVSRYMPAATKLAQSNIELVLQGRGAVGALALLGLLWSASGVFSAIYRAVNRAWGHATPASFWRHKLYALSMTFSVGVLFVALILCSAAVSFVRGWRIPVFGWQPCADVAAGRLTGWLSLLVPALVSVLVFSLVYRTMPRTHVTWHDVLPGGIAAGLAWETAKQLFTWYLGNFARYNLVYGSMGVVIAFLLWSYLSAIILILGAELTAQYSHWRQAGRPVESRPPREWTKEWS
jgi:membrane protein